MIVSSASTEQQYSHSSKKDSPLGLLISIIHEMQYSELSAHRREFRATLLSEGYEEFLDALISEWVSIKYSTAFRAANPPTASEIRTRAEARRKEKDTEASATSSAKSLIARRLLDMVTPNGKLLRDCTGTECVKLGGFYEQVGKKVGPRRYVGKVLSDDELATVLSNTSR